MISDFTEAELLECRTWLRSRPPSVQALAVRFPPACRVRAKPMHFLFVPQPGEVGQVAGYNESGDLLVRCERDSGSIQGWAGADRLELVDTERLTSAEVEQLLRGDA